MKQINPLAIHSASLYRMSDLQAQAGIKHVSTGASVLSLPIADASNTVTGLSLIHI